MTSQKVVFLVFDGVKQLDVAGPAEVFAEATRLGAAYELIYVSPTGAPAQTSIGTALAVGGAAADLAQADVVIVPGGDRVPTSPIEPQLLAATRRLVDAGARVASVCTGAFLLAAAGALDGRRATTHWEHAALLGSIYRNVEVLPDALFVQDGKFYTSAGVSAGIDLALSMVEADHGAELARDVARQLVVYMQRQGGQSQFSTMLQFSRGSQESVRRVVDAIAADPAADHTMGTLGRIAGMSPRHLTRLFHAELGTTPTRYVEGVRLETAKSLLLHGESVATAARRSGFQSAETMRRVFVSQLGMPPRMYQERFMTTAHRRNASS